MQKDDLRALTLLAWGHINPYETFRLDLDERLLIDGAASLSGKELGAQTLI